MKFIILVLFSILIHANALLTSKEVDLEWKNFLAKHKNKGFQNTKEQGYRKKTFESNLKIISDHNEKYKKGEVPFKMGITQFADMNETEFKEKSLSGLRLPKTMPKSTFKFSANLKAAASIDWRTKGCVSPVKDQGYPCGSCWAFAATGALESAMLISKRTFYPLSEQYLVDCSGSYGNYGCGGGLPSNAFDFIKRYGIPSSLSYPYKGYQAYCYLTQYFKVITTIKGYTTLSCDPTGANLMNALNIQPVVVLVDARGWQFYRSGVYPSCSQTVTHAVLAVGYDANSWIIKNSWGTTWGEQGYMRLDKRCVISCRAIYPSL